jgi:pSer/pThr/pTyr-binding forkhead associated (FHA) protein
MKLSLVVLATGKMQGKAIPVLGPDFIIGRDPQCQLRPASPMISKRHCALLQRDGKVFVRDFGSTNGTFINDRQLKGEIEVHHGDSLKAGPLAFRIEMEVVKGLDASTPLPPIKAPVPAEDEEAAALLLSLAEDGGPLPNTLDVDSSGVPTGSTVMDVMAPPNADDTAGEPGKPASSKAQPAPSKSGDTSSAAKTILEKYWRRPRT